MTVSESTGVSRHESTDRSVRQALAKTRCDHVCQVLDVEDCDDVEQLANAIEEARIELRVLAEILPESNEVTDR